MKKYLLIQIDLEKPIESLTDHVAQRAYVLDGVINTHAVLLDDEFGAELMASETGDAENSPEHR